VFPILLRLGPYSLPTYTFLIDLGIAAGLAWLYWRAPEGRSTRWLDAGMAATVGGFVGARLVYVAANLGYYLGHLGEIFRIWEGGLAWPGAALGGWLGLWLYCSRPRRREPILPLLDALALPIALLGLLSWGGCLAGTCAYGYEVTPGQLPEWMIIHSPDVYGLTAPRFPTQVIGIIWSLSALALVWSMRQRRWPEGAHALYALGLVALGPFLLGFTRGDPMPLVGGLRLDVIGSAAILFGSSLLWSQRLARPSPASSLQPPTSNFPPPTSDLPPPDTHP
jgi:phosphatidylglycerol:prolipoprotein diacylglycerol transferase